ncbi:hypothetical protein HHK36_003068 [Tetracentron sinense]|uniref:Jacalin-type lectin domain-containing protein n=1 Tax=Tetracentron sinense TaxID=13715 RepID=A0A835DS48_TETSI|nr:hypothetical protein HHK36_003068 [Tetracentron sinense]
MNCDEKNYISVGPWGGQDGIPWDDGTYSTVRQLVITYSAGIDSIQIEYDKKGNSVWSERHGGNGGVRTDRIKLDYPNEFFISISGYYGSDTVWGPVFVRSLTFQSNKQTYGPFGAQQGTQFSLPMSRGKIVGFHGRCSWYLDSIGVYLKPIQQQIPPKALVPAQNIVVNKPATQPFDSDAESNWKEVPYPPITARHAVSYGPWGGNGGMTFDDGVYTGVREVQLTRNGGISSIKVCYDRNGQAIWGNKNGGSSGIRMDKIAFDFPSEILTQITGYYGSTILMGPTIVKSLTFHTNKRKYGPFGKEQGISFSSDSKEGRIVGFHGRKGWFLDSIGVHIL